jgi:hypothetical protein
MARFRLKIGSKLGKQKKTFVDVNKTKKKIKNREHFHFLKVVCLFKNKRKVFFVGSGKVKKLMECADACSQSASCVWLVEVLLAEGVSKAQAILKLNSKVNQNEVMGGEMMNSVMVLRHSGDAENSKLQLTQCGLWSQRRTFGVNLRSISHPLIAFINTGRLPLPLRMSPVVLVVFLVDDDE